MIAATVTVVIDKNTVDEKRETYVVPLRKIGDLSSCAPGRWRPRESAEPRPTRRAGRSPTGRGPATGNMRIATPRPESSATVARPSR